MLPSSWSCSRRLPSPSPPASCAAPQAARPSATAAAVAVTPAVRRIEFAIMVPSVGGGDRKSTRLNSSHVASSYAVFCLKKKTRQITAEEEPIFIASGVKGILGGG